MFLYLCKICKISKVGATPMNENQSFIVFGDSRIKLSNIKNYGINTESIYYQKVYVKKTTKKKESILFFNWTSTKDEWVYEGHKVNICESDYNKAISSFTHDTSVVYKLGYFSKGDKCLVFSTLYVQGEPVGKDYVEKAAPEDGVYQFNEKATKEDFLTENEKYIYITTYQNDNFKFYSKDMVGSLENKLSELDKYLCS
jgi:hypothetical protein